jgi:hypothetical protein
MTIEIQMLKCQNYPFSLFEFWALSFDIVWDAVLGI